PSWRSCAAAASRATSGASPPRGGSDGRSPGLPTGGMRETAADLEAALAVAPVDERVYTLLAESGVDGDLFNQRQHRCCELVDRDPTYGPTFALLDEAAAVYPRVARGETTGEQALFQKVAIWTAYFNNTNPFYALNNRLAAQVAAARLPAGGGQVLEVGAGLG